MLEKTVIQVNQKHIDHHPLILLEVDNPAFIDVRKTLRMYTDINQSNRDNNNTQRVVYLGGKFGGFVLD